MPLLSGHCVRADINAPIIHASQRTPAVSGQLVANHKGDSGGHRVIYLHLAAPSEHARIYSVPQPAAERLQESATSAPPEAPARPPLGSSRVSPFAAPLRSLPLQQQQSSAATPPYTLHSTSGGSSVFFKPPGCHEMMMTLVTCYHNNIRRRRHRTCCCQQRRERADGFAQQQVVTRASTGARRVPPSRTPPFHSARQSAGDEGSAPCASCADPSPSAT